LIVRISRPAQRDIRTVYEFIATENPGAAVATVAALFDAINGLEHFPQRGRSGRIAGTRELVVRTGHVIAYAVRPDEVVIVRIRHGRQLWPQ
jgi:toxin ParE1/3/4